MKSSSPAHPGLRSTPRWVLLCVLSLASGCESPFSTSPSDLGQRVGVERLRKVDTLDLGAFAKPTPPLPTAADAGAQIEKPKSRFEGMKSLALEIDAVRAATLENNMDLKVALVDPTIAGQDLRREEAKFEAVFRPSIRYNENDAPVLNTTTPNQQNSLSVDAGVDIPLRSGGRVSVDMTEQWSETPNPFITFNTAYSSDVTFSISQPLLRNAGRETNTHSIRIAAYQEQISEARTKLEVIRQVAAVDRSYWRLYAADAELQVREEQYDLANTQLEQAKRRVRLGDAAEVEVIRAQAGVADSLNAIIVAENNLLMEQREMKRIINVPGLEMETSVKLVTKTPPTPILYEFDAAKLADQAVANRMEMLELELQLAQDASTINFEKNQALPLFTVDYQYAIQGLGNTLASSNGVLWRNNFESWSLGVSGSIPLGNEAAKARVQAAILTRLQRLSTREARRLAIRQEVLNAIDSVEAAWRRILAARQSTIAAARTYEAEKKQFSVGARTSTDVLDAATRLTDARSAEIRALADHQIAIVDLSFATGTLLGANRIDWRPLDPREPPPSNVSESLIPTPEKPAEPGEQGTQPVPQPTEPTPAAPVRQEP